MRTITLNQDLVFLQKRFLQNSLGNNKAAFSFLKF